METETRVQILVDFFDRLLIVLARPVVQRQLAAFLAVFLTAWLLAWLLSRLAQRWLRVRVETPGDKSWHARILRLINGIQYTVFPLLGLLFSALVVAYFDEAGWRTGLIRSLRPIFWLLLFYRILVGILHTVMNDARASIYTRRFLQPLLVLLIVILVGNRVGSALPLGDIELLQMLGATVTLRRLISAVVVLYFFLVFAWIARDTLSRVILSRSNTDAGVGNAIVITSYYSIMALGVLFAVSTLGFDLTTLTIVVGGLSVGISFGLQELVANFISGILLVFEQSLRPGDVIRVSGQAGTVDKLRLRSTVLKTLDNVEIFVPNKTLLTSTVETYTHTNRLVRQSVDVGVSYASKPEDVRDALLEIAHRHGLVLDDPAPTVFFTGFGDSSLNFQLLVWIDEPVRAMQIMSDLRFMIFREFDRRGIEIPFPQRDLHLRSDSVGLLRMGEAEPGSVPLSSPARPADGQSAQTGGSL